MRIFGMRHEEFHTGRYERYDALKGILEFWVGEAKGVFVTISFGKAGRSSHTASKEFQTSEEARRFLEGRVQQKVEEGFVLTSD
jgi:predicted DNA-binding WGR domain protein